jgi:1-pyrroline-5-carboxylate dehydrogenase
VEGVMAIQEDFSTITYATVSVEQADSFHAAFDRALDEVRGGFGADYPLIIDGRERFASQQFSDASPNDTRTELGRFQEAGRSEVAEAIAAAKQAFPAWSGMPYQERVALIRRVADTFRQHRFTLAALISYEAGKARLESAGEVQEAIELVGTYCDQMIDNGGFVRPLGQLSPDEVNYSILRPYGVWAVIAPFNFPVALSTNMILGALIAGNTVVFKPAPETPYTGLWVYKMFAEAGVPAGVLNYVTGGPAEGAGQALTDSPDVDGIIFTGSKEVGYTILKKGLLTYPRPVIAEMGGKNPVLVMESADLDKAAMGTARSAFGYSGQKCSAASRVYVHENVMDAFLDRLVAYTQTLTVGNPTERDVYMGPVVNNDAYQRFQRTVEVVRREGRVIVGGNTIQDGDLQNGYYVEPTVVDGLPKDHAVFRDELFMPFIAVAGVASFDDAIQYANETEFGLTAGLFSENQHEQDRFFQEMQAGVLYVNRASGATTGAWPGVQSFGGWRGSGSSGKGCLGPYYVQQFLREQSRTTEGIR